MADPVAGADSWFISDNLSLLPAGLLLGNDSDPDGDALTVTAVGDAINGVVSLVSGVVSFTPTAGTTSASFEYTVADGAGGSAIGTVSIAVTSTGSGNETVSVAALDPSAQFSYVNGGGGNDTIVGGDGPDTLLGSTGFDELHGGGGNDSLDGGLSANRLFGDDGDDLLRVPERGSAFGGAGNDTIYAGHARELDGGPGADLILGGAPRTIIHVDDPNDVVTGGRVYSSSVSFHLGGSAHLLVLQDGAIAGMGTNLANQIYGNAADNTLAGNGGRDALFGGDGADTLDGGSGRDGLRGGEGNDSLLGGVWHDILDGGGGQDTLVGGAHADTLTGGADKDIFRFAAPAETGPGDAARDVITDFDGVADNDKIHLKSIDANEGIGGDQAFSFIGASVFTGAAGQLRWEDIGADKLVQGDTNGDGIADLEILLQNHAGQGLVASDFVL
jgi:Ca2+-binding RTX toxin-like protein